MGVYVGVAAWKREREREREREGERERDREIQEGISITMAALETRLSLCRSQVSLGTSKYDNMHMYVCFEKPPKPSPQQPCMPIV